MSPVAVGFTAECGIDAALEEASGIPLGTTAEAEFWPKLGDAPVSAVEATPGRVPGSGFWMALETTLGTAFGAALETGLGIAFWTTSGSTPGMVLGATLAFAFGSAFEAGCGSVLESVFETTFATVLDKPAAACDTSETGGNVDAACEGSLSVRT